MEHFSASESVFVRQKQNFFAERNFFLAAKTKISCRKDVSGSVESGEKRGFGRPFLSNWRLSAHKIHLSFCKLSPSRADAGAASVRTTLRGGRRSVAESGFRLSSCIPATVRESRIPVRPRPCIRPRDSRGAGFDVLTECHPGFSGGKRMSPAGVSPGGYGIKAS